MDKVTDFIKCDCTTGTSFDGTEWFLSEYADGLVFFADSPVEVQISLDRFTVFADMNHLNIIISNCYSMVLHNSRTKINVEIKSEASPLSK